MQLPLRRKQLTELMIIGAAPVERRGKGLPRITWSDGYVQGKSEESPAKEFERQAQREA